MARNPLARALRLDKLGLAALDAVLRVLLESRPERIPTLRALGADASELRARAEKLALRLRQRLGAAAGVTAEQERSAVGGRVAARLRASHLGGGAACGTGPRCPGGTASRGAGSGRRPDSR